MPYNLRAKWMISRLPDDELANWNMNILVGMSGLKAAADLTKALRDGIKAGLIKPDEIAGRIGRNLRFHHRFKSRISIGPGY
jgi:hypothetical protein